MPLEKIRGRVSIGDRWDRLRRTSDDERPLQLERPVVCEGRRLPQISPPQRREAVTTSVSQLGIVARAAGIHLIFIAQRPDNTVFPMQLRTNLGNRLILRVEDEGTAKIALSETGAERLLGKGHIAAKLGGEPGPILGQVPFLEMSRIDEVAAIIARCTS